MLLKYYQKIDDAISYLFSSVCNEKNLLKKILKKNKIYYVDIGTNEGNFLDFLSNLFKFKKIICFEPINLMAKNLQIKYPNAQIKNIALSNKKSLRKFYEYKISSQSSLHKQNNTFKSLKELNTISNIKTDTFDSQFKKK